MSGSAVGRRCPWSTRRDAAGLIHEAWVLTPQEAEKLGGVNTGDARAKRFAELLAIILAPAAEEPPWARKSSSKPWLPG